VTSTPASSPAQTGLWPALKEAILGSEQDFTEGSLRRAIFLLAVPMVLEMAMESLFGVVDVFFVARLGADAVAAVAVTESMLVVVFSIALGLSMATTAMVARRIGEKDPEGAARAAVQALGLGLVASIPLSLVGALGAPALLRWMGAEPAVVDSASYTRIMLGGSITIFYLFLINAVFRGAGNAAIAMRVLWLSNSINIVLDPCLIFGWGPFPEMGVTGAAVATNIGRGLGVVYQLWVLFRGPGRILVTRRHLRLESAVALRLLRVSIGGVLQYLVATASWLGLVRIIAVFGSAPLAGYAIALRVLLFTILPSWGLSNAAATLVGQNLGASRPERAEQAVWRTGFYNMLFLGGVAVFFITVAEPIARLFTQDADVLRPAADCMRFVSYGYVFYAYGMVMEQAFNGAGDTTTPTLINLFCYWLFQIPLGYALALPLGMGPRGVFLAITLSESTLAVVAMLVFRRGRWKERRI
jgi:putative MATE family efflux protein